jgi:hypothetical protein
VKARLVRWSGLVLLAGLSAALLSACAVTEGGYAYTPEVRIGLDYYEPWPGDYGAWGPGYRVGPPRHPMPRPDVDRGRAPPRDYRPPPGSHPLPSIPSRPHPRGQRPRR